MGLKREHIIGKRPTELGIATHQEARFIRRQVIPRLMKGDPVRDVESVVRLKNGFVLPVSINFSLMRNLKGESIAIINVAKDVSRLKKAEAAIREFSRRMLTIREDEKRKIATNLHDEIGGLAVNLSTRLSLLEEEINDWKPAQARASIRRTKRELSAAVERLKGIALDLRPPQLDILGLPGALRDLVTGFSKKGSLRTRFQADEKANKIKGDDAITLYRVAQEALTNVVLHAKASRVTVRLSGGPAPITLSVRDNGKGFNCERILHSVNTIGIRGMQERMDSVKGRLTILSRPGQGTHVRAVLPGTRLGRPK